MISENMWISNRADWLGAIEIVDADTGAQINAESVTDLQIELADPESGSPRLTGSLIGGEVVAQDAAAGIYSFRFPASQTRALKAQTYVFAGRVTAGEDTRQLFLETIKAYDGVVA